MKAQNVHQYDDLTIIQKKVLHLVGARLRDLDKIREAIKKQDQMREKHAKVRGWKSVEQIRKWRDLR